MKSHGIHRLAWTLATGAICLISSSFTVAYQANQPAAQTDHPSPKPTHSRKNSPSTKDTAGTKPADAAPVVPGLTEFSEKTVVSNGGAREIRLQLTPTITAEQAAQQRRETHNLLSISNENLKRISPLQLNANQQDMLQQVHNYMAQARSADRAGELQRAQTLASKARQLSDDLAGVRTILKLWPW
jgi:uncharacterized protein YkwD